MTENRPGVCYERGEVLYQLLDHLGRVFYFFSHQYFLSKYCKAMSAIDSRFDVFSMGKSLTFDMSIWVKLGVSFKILKFHLKVSA